MRERASKQASERKRKKDIFLSSYWYWCNTIAVQWRHRDIETNERIDLILFANEENIHDRISSRRSEIGRRGVRVEEAETKSKDSNAFHCGTTVGSREEISREAVRVGRWTSGSVSLIEFNRNASEGWLHRHLHRSIPRLIRSSCILDLVSESSSKGGTFIGEGVRQILFSSFCLLIRFIFFFLSVLSFPFATQWKICSFRSTVNWNCQTKNSHHSVLIRCEREIFACEIFLMNRCPCSSLSIDD